MPTKKDTKDTKTKKDKSHSEVTDAVAYGAGSVAASTVAKPLNSLKLVQQGSSRRLPITEAFGKVTKGGYSKLWKGLPYYSAQQAFVGAAGGTALEAAKKNKQLDNLPTSAKLLGYSAAAGAGETVTIPLESRYFAKQLELAQKEGRKGYRLPPKGFRENAKHIARMTPSALLRNTGCWLPPITAAHIAEQHKLSDPQTAALGAASGVPAALLTSRLDRMTHNAANLTREQIKKLQAKDAKLPFSKRMFPAGTITRMKTLAPYTAAGALTTHALRKMREQEGQQR